jgi:predicted RNA-binding Zn ribbon-like protein
MVRSRFVFISEATALDFLNTEIVAEGRPVDLLARWADLVDWLVEARLLRKKDASAVRAVAGDSAEVMLDEIKAFRRLLRRLVLRLRDGGAPKVKELGAINGALRRGGGALRLSLEEGGMQLAFEADSSGARDPHFLIARAAAEFLAMADPSRIGICRATNCILIYYDTTKSRTRRWCSMATCGNRAKAALFYKRSRGEE